MTDEEDIMIRNTLTGLGIVGLIAAIVGSALDPTIRLLMTKIATLIIYVAVACVCLYGIIWLSYKLGTLVWSIDVRGWLDWDDD